MSNNVSSPGLIDVVSKAASVLIRQRREMAELVGFETRNKYSLELPDGTVVGFAAEQQKGFWGFLLRQFLGHWRAFEILIFDPERRLVARARHPFRIYFARLDVVTAEGRAVGSVVQRLSLLRKRFEIRDAMDRVVLEMTAPIVSIWQFPVFRGEVEVARIQKKWGGLLREAFLDADSFGVQFSDPQLTADERLLLISAALFIDLRYFEQKAR